MIAVMGEQGERRMHIVRGEQASAGGATASPVAR
jgi:hypothetical protein